MRSVKSTKTMKNRTARFFIHHNISLKNFLSADFPSPHPDRDVSSSIHRHFMFYNIRFMMSKQTPETHPCRKLWSSVLLWFLHFISKNTSQARGLADAFSIFVEQDCRARKSVVCLMWSCIYIGALLLLSWMKCAESCQWQRYTEKFDYVQIERKTTK